MADVKGTCTSLLYIIPSQLHHLGCDVLEVVGEIDVRSLDYRDKTITWESHSSRGATSLLVDLVPLLSVRD